MAQRIAGTDSLTGLNVGTASHKIAPHELQESHKGWTDKEGEWRTARGAEQLYSGYSSISCFAAGRMDGADHLVWMDGNTLYDNGTSAGTITAGASMKIIAIDDAFLILGAAVNYIYDGDHIREHGCWQPEVLSHLYLQKETPTEHGTNISGITKANPGVVTLTAHGYETGDYVYLDSLTEMTELNGRKFLVTKVNPNSFSINEDTSDHGAAETSSTGTAKLYAGLEGAYKWYLTCTVELSSGRVLESRPRGLRLGDLSGSGGTDVESWEAEEITMTPTDLVFIGQSAIKAYGRVEWVDNGAQHFEISGTIGTDYFPGLRLYRTKADGSDFYLEREYRHGDNNLWFVDSTDKAYYFNHDGTGTTYGSVLAASDQDLGAVYTAGVGDHDNPPASSLAAPVGQRLFVNDSSNPDRYYWPHLDGIEYYNELNWNKLPDTITGMAQLGRSLVLFSADRIWIDRFTNGLPDVREIRTDVGTTYGDAITTTDDGVLFLREDGLWLFDGARVVCISRRGFASIDDPACIAAAADTVYMCGSSDAYAVRQRDGGMVWHGADVAYPLADTTSGYFYGASTHDVSQLFVGARHGGRLKTADFTFAEEVQVDKVRIDLDGTSVPTVWVNGNRQSDNVPHAATGTDDPGTRRMIWVHIPRLSNHVFSVTLEGTGDCTIYGVWVEVAS